MKIKISSQKISILVLLISIWVLCGCQKQTPTIPAAIPPTVTKITLPTTQASTSTAPVPSMTPTLKTPTATWTSLPTKTPNPPTPTMIPKMGQGTAQAFALQLIKNDDNCFLPCWWGITPGKTKWSEARNYLRSFVDNIEVIADRYLPGHFIFETTIIVPEKISKDGKILQDYMTLNDEIVMILTRIDPGMGFDVESLFETYGTPAEIRLFAIPEPREGLLPYSLVFRYPANGFMALYYGKAQYNNGRIRICPQNIAPGLWIWPPDQNLSFEEVIALNGGGHLSSEETKYYLPIENTINISLDELYKLFTGESADRCFETTSDKWTWPSVP